MGEFEKDFREAQNKIATLLKREEDILKMWLGTNEDLCSFTRIKEEEIE